MRASDIMTTSVVTVAPGDTVKKAAELMARRHVSALPVVDANGKLVGMISEGDLLHRSELHTEKKRSWWLQLVAGGDGLAKDYIKAFAAKVKDVMVPEVITVADAASLAEIAELLEVKRIKRVPVMRGGKMVGIVSRANLIQALATLPRLIIPDTKPDDAAIRYAIMAEIAKQRWASPNAMNVTVQNGVVHLWGTVFSATERQALRVAAERTPGVRGVQDHLAFFVPPPII